MNNAMAQTRSPDFLAYKWQYIEDKKGIFLQHLDEYLLKVKRKVFESDVDADVKFDEALNFLVQPFPDDEDNQVSKDTKDLTSQVTDLKDELSGMKQEIEDLKKTRATKQSVSGLHTNLLKEKREVKKVKVELKKRNKELTELKNTHSLAQKTCGQLMARLTKLHSIQVESSTAQCVASAPPLTAQSQGAASTPPPGFSPAHSVAPPTTASELGLFRTEGISDILVLTKDLVLVALSNGEGVDLYNTQGQRIQKHFTKGKCKLSLIRDCLVVMLDTEHKTIELLHVKNTGMSYKPPKQLDKSKDYGVILSLDNNKLAISCTKPQPSIDICDFDGRVYYTIGTIGYVNYMCKSDDETIFCSEDNEYISKYDIKKATQLFCIKVPQMPFIKGLAYLPGTRTILTCGEKDGLSSLSLLESNGRFLRQIWNISCSDLYQVSVQPEDRICVCGGDNGLFCVLELA